MPIKAGLMNFSRGEISPELQSRVDVPAYSAALKRARNVRIRKYGGVTKRAGTHFVAPAYGTTVRLFPFQFSLEQAYALEMGQAYMRPAALGGMVLETGLTITGITKASQAVITVPYHGYVVGDQVYPEAVIGMVEINDRILNVVSVPDHDTIIVDIDTRTFGTFTGSGGGTTNVAPPPAPPPPPPVPTPPPPPPPAEVGGGGGYGTGGGNIGGDYTGLEAIP